MGKRAKLRSEKAAWNSSKSYHDWTASSRFVDNVKIAWSLKGNESIIVYIYIYISMNPKKISKIYITFSRKLGKFKILCVFSTWYFAKGDARRICVIYTYQTIIINYQLCNYVKRNTVAAKWGRLKKLIVSNPYRLPRLRRLINNGDKDLEE